MGKPFVVNQAGMRILIDPDDPARVPKKMVKYTLDLEEIEKIYGHVKGQRVGTVIPGFNSDKVKQIRMREREETN